jgi:hypothetical protein
MEIIPQCVHQLGVFDLHLCPTILLLPTSVEDAQQGHASSSSGASHRPSGTSRSHLMLSDGLPCKSMPADIQPSQTAEGEWAMLKTQARS